MGTWRKLLKTLLILSFTCRIWPNFNHCSAAFLALFWVNNEVFRSQSVQRSYNIVSQSCGKYDTWNRKNIKERWLQAGKKYSIFKLAEITSGWKKNRCWWNWTFHKPIRARGLLLLMKGTKNVLQYWCFLPSF